MPLHTFALTPLWDPFPQNLKQIFHRMTQVSGTLARVGGSPRLWKMLFQIGATNTVNEQQREPVPNHLHTTASSQGWARSWLRCSCTAQGVSPVGTLGPEPVPLWSVVRDGCVLRNLHGRHFHGVFQEDESGSLLAGKVFGSQVSSLADRGPFP